MSDSPTRHNFMPLTMSPPPSFTIFTLSCFYTLFSVVAGQCTIDVPVDAALHTLVRPIIKKDFSPLYVNQTTSLAMLTLNGLEISGVENLTRYDKSKFSVAGNEANYDLPLEMNTLRIVANYTAELVLATVRGEIMATLSPTRFLLGMSQSIKKGLQLRHYNITKMGAVRVNDLTGIPYILKPAVQTVANVALSVLTSTLRNIMESNVREIIAEELPKMYREIG